MVEECVICDLPLNRAIRETGSHYCGPSCEAEDEDYWNTYGDW